VLARSLNGRDQAGAGEDSPVTVRYIPSERWTLRHEDGLLLLSAGADELYAIEDVVPETAAELAAAWQRETLSYESLSAPARAVVEQLVTAGIVVPERLERRRWRVTSQCVGDGCSGLERAIRVALESSLAVEAGELEQSDLVVFVRTNGRLIDVYEGTPGWQARPHLLLDAAYEHTVSLGPLVFFGDTACLGCVAGRIGHYWGDVAPPPRPAVLRFPTLVAELLALELDKIAGGDTGLVNATVSWDLRGWAINRNAVYKLPWCPLCGDLEAPAQLGSIDLPWAGAR
jgi:bacteriocin biosynthesis cyclodehydratase domain-containing protein